MRWLRKEEVSMNIRTVPGTTFSCILFFKWQLLRTCQNISLEATIVIISKQADRLAEQYLMSGTSCRYLNVSPYSSCCTYFLLIADFLSCCPGKAQQLLNNLLKTRTFLEFIQEASHHEACKDWGAPFRGFKTIPSPTHCTYHLRHSRSKGKF